MVAVLSKFRTGDTVVVDATEEFYSGVDGWRGRVIAVGPKAPTAVHSQVPEGYCAIEVQTDAATGVLLVPHDQLRLSV